MTIIAHAAEIRPLLDAGYEISFALTPDGYVASVSGPDGYEHDAIAATLEEALAVAAPCPAWCRRDHEFADEHVGDSALDDDGTSLVLTRVPGGETTAAILGESPIDKGETVIILSAAALGHLTEILPTL